MHAVHVSTTGRDDGAGSEAEPLATLAAALTVARRAPANERRIVLHGGRYSLAEPLVLDARDSGLTIEAAGGETPVLYGGRVLDGWRAESDGRFWSAPAPGADPGSLDFRQLYVNGEPRPRARLPEQGEWHHASVFNQPWLTTAGGGFQPPPSVEARSTLVYGPEQVPPDFSLKNAEFAVFCSWDESQTRAVAHDPATRTLRLEPPCNYPPGAFGITDYHALNLREGMTRPGQWYVDRDRGCVVYWPLPGDDPGHWIVEVPVTTALLNVEGNADARATGITLRGLVVDLCGVRLAASGWGAAPFEGAVAFRHVRGGRLENLTVRRAGGQGIKILDADDTCVRSCLIEHTGANGIFFHRGAGNAILDSRVRHAGEIYPSACGVNAGHWTRGTIARNEVSDCAYCGIALGNGMKEQAPAENLVEHNHVWDVMTGVDDGGCLYLYGIERGTLVRGNRLHGARGRAGNNGMGLYLDENVEDIVCEDNVVFDISKFSLHVHMGKRNVLRHNRFVCDPGCRISFARSNDCLFENNTVCGREPVLTFLNPAGAAFRGNTYLTEGGAPRFDGGAYTCYGSQPFPKGYLAEAGCFTPLSPLPRVVTRFVNATGAEAPAPHRCAFELVEEGGRLLVTVRVERPAPGRGLAGAIWVREHAELFLKPFADRDGLLQVAVAADGERQVVWHGAEAPGGWNCETSGRMLDNGAAWEARMALPTGAIVAACGGGSPRWGFLAGYTVALNVGTFAEWQALGRDAEGQASPAGTR